VPAGTSCYWRYAFERRARITKRHTAPRREHGAKHRLRASENAPSSTHSVAPLNSLCGTGPLGAGEAKLARKERAQCATIKPSPRWPTRS
jgi:hypothetical protein